MRTKETVATVSLSHPHESGTASAKKWRLKLRLNCSPMRPRMPLGDLPSKIL